MIRSKIGSFFGVHVDTNDNIMYIQLQLNDL